MTDPTCPCEFALRAWPAIWLADLLRYLIPASAAALVLAFLPRAWTLARTVRSREPVPGQRRHEFLHSMLTVLVFSMNGALIVAGVRSDALRLYTDWSALGTFYGIASLALLILLHDTWFYWTHRLLHRPHAFRWFHRTHHLSVAPTPWAAYSFALGEAVVQAAFLPIVLLGVPLHPVAIFVFLTHMIVRNVIGHAGVEPLPRAWLAGWWGRWCTTTLHHDMHHAQGTYNFGLYFRLWDRLCGTEHPDYPRRLESLVQRIEPPGSAVREDKSAGCT
jgi:sterol desaturase/sphingolipid hydroxylase (fatty acid hydroxylase superfamily)